MGNYWPYQGRNRPTEPRGLHHLAGRPPPQLLPLAGRIEHCERLIKAKQEKTEPRPLRRLVRTWRIDAPNVPPPRRAE